MTKQYEYRAWEFKSGGQWQPAGVAYMREGKIHYFSPITRYLQLEVGALLEEVRGLKDLDELEERHLPHPNCRWGEIRTFIVTDGDFHPARLVQDAAGIVESPSVNRRTLFSDINFFCRTAYAAFLTQLFRLQRRFYSSRDGQKVRQS